MQDFFHQHELCSKNCGPVEAYVTKIVLMLKLMLRLHQFAVLHCAADYDFKKRFLAFSTCSNDHRCKKSLQTTSRSR